MNNIENLKTLRDYYKLKSLSQGLNSHEREYLKKLNDQINGVNEKPKLKKYAIAGK